MNEFSSEWTPESDSGGGPPLRQIVFAALMAAFTAAGAWISLPIGPVPIVLQNFFIYISGLLLGPRWAMASVAVYLLAGACGMPVFAGGTGGPARFVGPTGGYLAGFLPAAGIIGWIGEKGGGKIVLDAAAMVAGTAVIYACGLTWLQMLTHMSGRQTLSVGMLPFLPGDAVKMAAAVIVLRVLRPIVRISDPKSAAAQPDRRRL